MTTTLNDNKLIALLDDLDAAKTKATEPPYYVATDRAGDCPEHHNSGLALVDTGRGGDWPVARLCEWPTAGFLADVANAYPALSTALRERLEHRCPHFQPKGEDTGGAYNAKVIADVTEDLLDPWERERTNGTRWYQLRIKNLIQRIANLRLMLAASSPSSLAGEAVEKAARNALEWFAGFPHQGSVSHFDRKTATDVYEQLDAALKSVETKREGINVIT